MNKLTIALGKLVFESTSIVCAAAQVIGMVGFIQTGSVPKLIWEAQALYWPITITTLVTKLYSRQEAQ